MSKAKFVGPSAKEYFRVEQDDQQQAQAPSRAAERVVLSVKAGIAGVTGIKAGFLGGFKEGWQAAKKDLSLSRAEFKSILGRPLFAETKENFQGMARVVRSNGKLYKSYDALRRRNGLVLEARGESLRQRADQKLEDFYAISAHLKKTDKVIFKEEFIDKEKAVAKAYGKCLGKVMEKYFENKKKVDEIFDKKKQAHRDAFKKSVVGVVSCMFREVKNEVVGRPWALAKEALYFVTGAFVTAPLGVLTSGVLKSYTTVKEKAAAVKTAAAPVPVQKRKKIFADALFDA